MTTVSPPNSSQIEAAAALYHDAWHETQARFQDPRVVEFRGRSFFLRRVKAAQGSSLVAWRDGRCVGYAGWEDADFRYLFVAPGIRGQGTGQSLLAASEAAMRAAGVEEARLNCLFGKRSPAFL